METITDELEELKSTHEEADMRIVLHCLHSAEDSRVNDIIIISPDTDIFVVVLHCTEHRTKRAVPYWCWELEMFVSQETDSGSWAQTNLLKLL